MVKSSTHDEDGWEGDNRYMAKELLNSSKKHYSADIFSLGIMFYEVAAGVEPPREGNAWHAFRDDKVPQVRGRSDALNDIIARMVSSDPCKRPSANEILQHPCVRKATQIHDNFVMNVS